MGESLLSTFLRYTEMRDSGLSILSAVLAVVLGGAILLWAQRLYTLYSSRRPDAVLPKGSLGWPIIGESLDFVRNPKEFAHSRVRRYGSTFKTNLFLLPTICGTTPEFSKFVNTSPHLFRRSFPENLKQIIGPKAFLLQDGPPHMSIRKLVLKFFGPDSLRHQVHSVESIILENMASWVRAGTVDGVDATQKITWDISNWVLFGDKNRSSSPEGKKNFANFQKLMIGSIPVNLPGTTYSNCLKARANVIAYIRALIDGTKGQKISKDVFLGVLLAARDTPEGLEELKHLDDLTLADNMYFLSFAAYDNTATTLVWVLKYLIDYPKVFRRCQAEHQEILRNKDPSVEGPRLTWDDTRKMVYTHKFFNEIQRSLSILPVIFKEAVEDVKFEGQLIPKGWIVAPLTIFTHTDPANYPDLNFNPDRFDVPPKPYTYLPFNTGSHMCPGIEMAKLIVCVCVHHLTTTYMHESALPDRGMEYDRLLPLPKGGYQVKLSPRK